MRKSPYIITTLLLLLYSNSPLLAQKNALSLLDALEMAKNGNKALQAQILEERHSEEVTRETKRGLLPDISANVIYARYFDRQTIFLPGSFVNTSNPVENIAVGGKNTYNAYVSLHQPILAPSIHRQTKSLVLSEKIQTEKTAELASQVALRVTKHYLDILMMERQLDLLEQSFNRNIKALADSRSLLTQGRALKSDTLRSYIAVENLKSSTSYLKNNRNIASLELKRLIGMEDENELQLTDNLDLDMPISRNDFYDIDKAFKIAETNRKDLNIQKMGIDLQQKKMEVVQAELLPKLSLIGQYQIQAQADNMRIDNYTWPRTSFLGLQLAIPVFNGNRTRSRITQANIKTEQEKIRLNDLNDEAKTEIASIVSKGKEAINQLKIQETTVRSAELNYQIMQDRFKNGLGSRLELTDAELALTQARINNLQATYDLRVLHIELQYALGLLKL